MYNRENIYKCTFVKRLNRFVATVILDGEEIDVHVKNTGRCTELLVEGCEGYLVKSDNAKRKYAYDLISIYKEDKLVNFDSQVPNAVVADYIMEGKLFTNVTKIKREVKYKNSRFDIYVERYTDQGELEKIFIEVKGVTLFNGNNASFPDAPTVRGTKHLTELIDAKTAGYKTYVFFLAQAEGIESFTANDKIDPKFAKTLKLASENGVEILCFNSEVTKDNIQVKDKVKVLV